MVVILKERFRTGPGCGEKKKEKFTWMLENLEERFRTGLWTRIRRRREERIVNLEDGEPG